VLVLVPVPVLMLVLVLVLVLALMLFGPVLGWFPARDFRRWPLGV
jgi:hypothetical protein